MIELKQGDLLHSAAEALVNTVNCVGVMGRGIALQFRKAFPESFAAYKTLCERGGVKPGRMMVYDLGRLSNPRYVIDQLPNQAALERQEPNGGHRGRSHGVG
jgi:O-acetyl-ADP-ribose deacetylase (regulator of RNase III)